MSTVELERRLVAASAEEVAQIKELDSALSQTDADQEIRYFLADSTGNRLELPRSMFKVLGQAAHAMARGHSVVIVHYDHELTTQEAADILQVSRPYLIKLLEKGQIPYSFAGTHRRIRMRDLLAYKRTRDTRRSEALRELRRVSDDLGLYESKD